MSRQQQQHAPEGWTAGPWELRGPTAVYGNLQHDQNQTGDLVARTVEPRDARLIASAPDLYKAVAAEANNPITTRIATERAGLQLLPVHCAPPEPDARARAAHRHMSFGGKP